MTPLERYQQDLASGELMPDSAQMLAVEKLQNLYDRLLPTLADEAKASLLDRWFGKKSQPEPVRGLYFWGGVGRGKTYLMDAFFDSLPTDKKLRVHFHRFMQMVHKRLTALAGEKNPLPIIAGEIAGQYRIICFDEFFVTDITDAMILGGLMEAVFALGVSLVATSNIVPDRLYENGLQRSRFLPAIEQLKRHTEVVNVDGGVDYRLRVLQRAEIYHSPLDDAAWTGLEKSFQQLAPDHASIEQDVLVEIEGRKLPVVRLADDVIWFEFKTLCDGPRSQNDYIEIARIYHAVLVSNVPQLGVNKDDQTRRFINFVDEMYDRGVKLILSAEVPIQSLYTGGRLSFEFERTQSRLLEMQSHDYLAREHKA